MNKLVRNVVIAGGAIAICAVLGAVSREHFAAALPIVYSCLIVLIVAAGVLTAKAAFYSDEVGRNELVLSVTAAASLLYCFVSGGMYELSSWTFDGFRAETCFIVMAAVFALFVVVSILICFFRDDDGGHSAGGPFEPFSPVSDFYSESASTMSSGGNVGSGQQGHASRGGVEASATSSMVRGLSNGGMLDTVSGKVTLLVSIGVLIACIAYCLAGAPIEGMDSSTFDGVFRAIVFGVVLAVVLMIAIAAVVFLAKIVFCMASFNVRKRTVESVEGDERYLDASVVICALVGTVLLIRFPDFKFEDLLSVFGGADYLALPIAGAIAVVSFAVFVRIVAAVLKLATSRFGRMKEVASECVAKLLDLIDNVLRKIIEALNFIPDFLALAMGGVEDKEAEEWMKGFTSKREERDSRQETHCDKS